MGSKIQFCPECNNMLYPKERERDKTLLMCCKHCAYEEEAESPTIYLNKFVKDTATRLDLVDPALATDPTLPRSFNAHCIKCGGTEAVFFMSRSGGRDSDMALIFLCVQPDCHYKWMN